MNKLIFIGNLGRDPELRYMPNGNVLCTFPVAVNKRWTDDRGSLHDQVLWYRVSTWGRQAETCNQYLAKGKKVLIEGELAFDEKTGGPRVYTRKDGTTGASFEVRAYNVEFLTPSGQNPGVEEQPVVVGEMGDDNISF